MRSTYGTKTRSAVDGCSPPRIHGPGRLPSSFSSRSVLLIGDSISMGYGFARGAPRRCACGSGAVEHG